MERWSATGVPLIFITDYFKYCKPVSSVSIVSDYGLDDRAIEVRFPAQAKGFFLYPLCPDRLWGPPSLLYNGYRGSIPRGYTSVRCDASHSPHLVLRSWMSRSLYFLSPQAPPCRVSSGSIVSDYGLDDRAIGVRSPADAGEFFL
jgi:hypothetical protein